jgi:hypothetical protein
MKASFNIIEKLCFSIVILLISSVSISQGTNCNNAAPFCTTSAATFPAGVNQPDATVNAPGNNYDCLASAPNPAWYYLEIDQSGNLVIDISNNGLSFGSPADIDFAVWGPFNDVTAAINACGSLAMPVSCSFSPTAYPEQAIINGAVSNQVYIMLVTNYANIACDITLSNVGNSTTNCNIVNPCSISSLSTNSSSCIGATGNFNITGNITFLNPPTTGQLIIQNCSGDSAVLNPPFVSPISYNINDITGDGTTNCSVTANFTDDSSCVFTSNTFVEPICSLNCSIQSITHSLSNCDTVALTFDITGDITFLNPPSTGQLIIQSCSGDSVIYNAPFISPFNYNISDIDGDGTSNCNVSAVFTDDTACTFISSNFTEPVCFVNCVVQSVSQSLSDCDTVALTFDVSGSIEFLNPPSTGQLIVQNCSGDSVIFNAPFISPIVYSIDDISGDGSTNCSVTANFTDDSSCTLSSNLFTEPLCSVSCFIQSIDNSVSSCNPISLTFNCFGEIEFVNPPTSGQLVVQNCSGDTAVYYPPFISPLNYNINDISADGTTNCIVIAFFTDDSLCSYSSAQYNEPLCLPPPEITSLEINYDSCGIDLHYSGLVSFTNPPSLGQLIINDCHGIQQVFAPPFISPLSYVLNDVPADGQPCNVNAYFSDDTTINFSTEFNTYELKTPSFFWIPENPDIFNTTIDVYNSSEDAVSFDWELDINGSSEFFNNEYFNYTLPRLETGTYPICLKIVRDLGCEASFCDTLKVINPLLVYVPSAFTPLGLNNEFKPVISGVQLDAGNYLLQIFNRNGEVVFESKDIINGWNGKYNGTGSMCPVGVYVWKVMVNNPIDNKSHDYIGNITLLK